MACLLPATQVAEATSRNKSSMLQDMLSGRPTEVEYLSGYVVRHAREVGLDAPRNETLYQLVKTREQLAVHDNHQQINSAATTSTAAAGDT